MVSEYWLEKALAFMASEQELTPLLQARAAAAYRLPTDDNAPHTND